MKRFGDALNLNVHFHSLVLDGVYTRSDEGELRFHPLPPPEDAEVERVARQVVRRVDRLLERRGHGELDDDALATQEPLLPSLHAAEKMHPKKDPMIRVFRRFVPVTEEHVIAKFVYLKVGLSFVLVFVGAKMLAADFYKVPIGLSLGIIALIPAGSIVPSIWKARADSRRPPELKSLPSRSPT